MRYATTISFLILRGEIRHKLEVLKMKFSGNVLAQQSLGEHFFKYITRTVCNKEILRTANILSLRVVHVHAVGIMLLEQAVANKICWGNVSENTKIEETQ